MSADSATPAGDLRYRLELRSVGASVVVSQYTGATAVLDADEVVVVPPPAEVAAQKCPREENPTPLIATPAPTEVAPAEAAPMELSVGAWACGCDAGCTFCKACIAPWVAQSGTCPTCNASLAAREGHRNVMVDQVVALLVRRKQVNVKDASLYLERKAAAAAAATTTTKAAVVAAEAAVIEGTAHVAAVTATATAAAGTSSLGGARGARASSGGARAGGDVLVIFDDDEEEEEEEEEKDAILPTTTTTRRRRRRRRRMQSFRLRRRRGGGGEGGGGGGCNPSDYDDERERQAEKKLSPGRGPSGSPIARGSQILPVPPVQHSHPWHGAVRTSTFL